MGNGSDAGSWFEEALAERDPAAAVEIVGEPGRLLAASVNPEVALPVLRALAALAWRTDDAAAVMARVQWADSVEVRRARERVQLDIAAGREFRRAYTPVLPPYLHELVAVAPFVDGERRVELAAALRAELTGDTAYYLELLEVLHQRCHALATALSLRLLDDVAWNRREVGALLPEQKAELDRALHNLNGGFATTLATVGALGAGVVGAAVGIVFDPGLAIAAGGGSAVLVTSLRGRVYRRFVRLPLTRLIATCGLTRACARERMMQHGGFLRRFAAPAGDDHALRLFGMIAAAATTIESQGAPTWQPPW